MQSSKSGFVDQVLHEPNRLSIMAYLSRAGKVNCSLLLRQTGLTWGNLHSHLRKLEEAEYVTVEKTVSGKRLRTMVSVTEKGQGTLNHYCSTMRIVMGGIGTPPADVISASTIPDMSPFPVTATRGIPNRSGKAAQDAISVLRKSSAFGIFGEPQLKEVSALTTEHRLKGGQFVFFGDEELQYFYVIAEGRIKIVRQSLSGKDFILAYFHAGDIFGNIALLTHRPHPASAQAVCETRLLAIKASDFLAFLFGYPFLAFDFQRHTLEAIGMQPFRASRRLADMAIERVDRRVVNTLLTLSLEFGSVLPFTRREIAEMSGTSTESVIRFINNLKNRAIVRSGQRQLTVLDLAELQALAEAAPTD